MRCLAINPTPASVTADALTVIRFGCVGIAASVPSFPPLTTSMASSQIETVDLQNAEVPGLKINEIRCGQRRHCSIERKVRGSVNLPPRSHSGGRLMGTRVSTDELEDLLAAAPNNHAAAFEPCRVVVPVDPSVEQHVLHLATRLALQ